MIPIFVRADRKNFVYFYQVKLETPCCPQPQKGLLHLMSPSLPFCVPLLQPSQSSEAPLQVTKDITY